VVTKSWGLWFVFGPGAAYTCLEAATGRALLRQHMDITGEDNPLNKLRVKIEPGPGGSSSLPLPLNWLGAPSLSKPHIDWCTLQILPLKGGAVRVLWPFPGL
jgi:hypothetical protein